MWIGILAVMGMFGVGVAASVLAGQKKPVHHVRSRYDRACVPAGEPTAADVAAAPLSAELLDRVLHARSVDADPYAIDVAAGPRRQLAIAFTLAAIASLGARNTRAKYLIVSSVALFVLSGFVPMPYPFLLWFITLTIFLVSVVVFADEWRRRSELSALGGSDAGPAEVAARLREIAGWPAAQGDPLVGYPVDG